MDAQQRRDGDISYNINAHETEGGDVPDAKLEQMRWYGPAANDTTTKTTIATTTKAATFVAYVLSWVPFCSHNIIFQR